MSLATNVTNLATRIATEAKSLRTLINGNAADLSSLDTATKTNLVAAINEVAAAVASGAGIDDNATSTSSTWSSSKTDSEITSASTADRARTNHTGTQSADTLTDGTTNKAYLATERTKLSGIAAGATANSTDAQLRDRSTHTGTQTVSTLSDFTSSLNAALAALKDEILGGAGAAFDTLGELQALIADNQDLIAALETAAANRVRFDAAQSLTSPQQAQARANIGAASAADVGDTSTDFVGTFESALI